LLSSEAQSTSWFTSPLAKPRRSAALSNTRRGSSFSGVDDRANHLVRESRHDARGPESVGRVQWSFSSRDVRFGVVIVARLASRFTRERQCTRLRLIGGLTGASGRGDRGDEDQRRNQLR